MVSGPIVEDGLLPPCHIDLAETQLAAFQFLLLKHLLKASLQDSEILLMDALPMTVLLFIFVINKAVIHAAC